MVGQLIAIIQVPSDVHPLAVTRHKHFRGAPGERCLLAAHFRFKREFRIEDSRMTVSLNFGACLS